MADEVDLIVEAVCRLPLDYESLQRMSAVEVLRRSGYARRRADVTVARVAACLAAHPAWIRAWFRWSDDTRAHSAWFIRRWAGGEFEVGFFDGIGIRAAVMFDDETRACAEYVLRAIRSIDGDDDPPGGRTVAADARAD